jgi:hypothetical protein
MPTLSADPTTAGNRQVRYGDGFAAAPETKKKQVSRVMPGLSIWLLLVRLGSVCSKVIVILLIVVMVFYDNRQLLIENKPYRTVSSCAWWYTAIIG